jgi:hypothetical protein
MIPLEGFLRSSVLLTMSYRNEDGIQKTWIGSGAIRYRGGQAFLITALHNLTGREPNGRCKDSDACLPNFVKIEGYYTRFEVPLYAGDNDPSNDSSLYWLHPRGATIDVGVLPLGFGGRPGSFLDESLFDPIKNALESRVYVTQNCFVVGFPERLVDRTDPSFPRPIFKTAHIAFDPRIDFQGQPIVLIDATTRQGQSGSPVFASEMTYRGQAISNCLIGIYAGRYASYSDSGKEQEHVTIGRVFKPKVITEIFDAHG